MRSRKEIQAGDESTNIQDSENVTVTNTHNYGVTYADARQIALDVFKANFYELSEAAKATAVERAEQLVNNLMAKIQSQAPESISKIQYPDVQYAVVNAQKHYARSGNTDSLNLLTDLLKDRFLMDEGSLKAIILNEAIEVLPKLTINQIKIICTIFLVKNVKLPKARLLIDNVSQFLFDHGIHAADNLQFYEHLLFVGVAAHDNLVSAEQNLEYFIRKNYKHELNYASEGPNRGKEDPPVINQFIIDDISRDAFNKWNNSFAKRYVLTSVGIAIAVAYYNAEKGANIDLGIWIKE